MPIPTSLSDLSQTAADNYPTGSEVIGSNLDNYLRAHASFIRQPYALASASIASASTVDVSASDGESVLITGTTTITSLGTGFNGCKRELRFEDALQLTHSDNLKLPGANNISTAAGDIHVFRCTGSGVWEYVSGSTGGGSSGGSGDVPQVSMAANRTLALTDTGKHILRTGGTLSVPTNATVAFPVGSIVTVVNHSTSSMTIAALTGVTLYMATSASTGNKTLAKYGVATLLKTATDTWYVTGAGLS